MFGQTNRRAFIAGLGSAAGWPLLAPAQQSGKVPRIGVLWHAGNEEEEAPFLGALRQGLADLGYVEGKTIELVNRFPEEHYDRFGALAKELVASKVDVIVASIGPAAAATKRATTTIPVVFVVVADPVGEHLVSSLARPGENLTGLSVMTTDLTAKRMEILKQSLPSFSNVALIYNPGAGLVRGFLDDAQAAARSLNVTLALAEASAANDLDQVFLQISGGRPDAVMTAPDAMLYNERRRIADLAKAHRLPIMGSGDAAEAGMLMSYGPDLLDIFRRSALYVDKILKGAKPGELPVEQPTKFRLLINLRTAQAIGVTIPPLILARADKAIE